MKRFQKKFVLATAALAASALALTGCGAGGGSANGNKTITIGWIPPNNTGVFNTATQYFNKAAEEANKNGLNVKIVTQAATGGEANTAGLNQIIENMISQKVNVITVSPGDMEAIKPAVRLANQAGIPVVYVNTLDDQQGINVSGYVGFDNANAAKVSAYAVLDYLSGSSVLAEGSKEKPTTEQALDLQWWEKRFAKVDQNSIKANGVIIEGIKGTSYSNQRLAGFHSVIDQFPNVHILDTLPGDWERGKASKAAEDLLTKNSTNLDFLWTASNEMSFGAINVASQVNRLDVNPKGAPRTPGKVAIFTNDNTAESTDAIRQGKIIAETTHGFPEWGWLGTAIAVKLACGESIEKKNDINPRTVYSGNADQFYPTPQLAKVDWASINSNCKK